MDHHNAPSSRPQNNLTPTHMYTLRFLYDHEFDLAAAHFDTLQHFFTRARITFRYTRASWMRLV